MFAVRCLQELLYHNSDGKAEEDNPKRGYVQLVSCTAVLRGRTLLLTFPAACACQVYCTDEGTEIAFARHIQPASSDPDATYQSIYKAGPPCASWQLAQL